MAEIHLAGGHVALIDEADVSKTFGFGWHAVKPSSGKGLYVRARIGGRRVSLHRWLMGEPADMVVDHINGDGLDNRRQNLRVCHHFQNSANRQVPPKGHSGYIGVQQFGLPGRYRAMLRYNNARLHLGVFDDPEEAAVLRDYVARHLIGEFGAYNFSQDRLPQRLTHAAAEVLKRYGA